MTGAIVLFTLLHLLVLVYWLGGDLGAFYGSSFLTDPARGVAERAMALKILNNIDMAPRTALILALPTGLTLAWLKGWLDLPVAAPVAVWAFSLAWLVTAWAVHLRHAAEGSTIKRADIAIRWVILVTLAATALLALGHVIALPLFIALKLLVLATAIALGLVVRRQLVPLFSPVREMLQTGPTPATDTAIAGVIARTRPVVVALWLLLLTASLLGIAQPL